LAIDEKQQKCRSRSKTLNESKWSALEGSLSGEAKEVKGEIDGVAKIATR